jgi:hypothetical protein
MSRLLAVLVVAFLAFSASGAAEVLLPEPCSAECADSSSCATCMPTCHRCGCCVQAVVLLGSPADEPLTARSAVEPVLVRKAPDARARKILHVPKPVTSII